MREATSKEFCIGIKLNSVDASTSESLDDVIAQIRLIAEAGIDFIEISGGSYENPRMGADAVIPSNPKKSTALRESFFLEFAKTVRQEFPKLVLMVTGKSVLFSMSEYCRDVVVCRHELAAGLLSLS